MPQDRVWVPFALTERLLRELPPQTSRLEAHRTDGETEDGKEKVASPRVAAPAWSPSPLTPRFDTRPKGPSGLGNDDSQAATGVQTRGKATPRRAEVGPALSMRAPGETLSDSASEPAPSPKGPGGQGDPKASGLGAPVLGDLAPRPHQPHARDSEHSPVAAQQYSQHLRRTQAYTTEALPPPRGLGRGRRRPRLVQQSQVFFFLPLRICALGTAQLGHAPSALGWTAGLRAAHSSFRDRIPRRTSFPAPELLPTLS